jgi:Flp pilus assembly protein TadD
MSIFAPASRPTILSMILAWALVPAAAQSEPTSSLPADQQVSQWIEQLGDKDYLLRQRAQEELAKLGFLAYDAISAATRHEDLEIASRARYLLGLMRMHWCEPSDPAEVRKLLDKYELQDVEGRSQRIRALARFRNGAGVPVLCRLVRYEESELLSKYAAIEILNWEPADQAGRLRLAQMLREKLGPSERPAARWLLTYQGLREDPAATEAAWIEQIESEEALAKSSSDQSNAFIIMALLYHLAEVQVQQGQTEQAEATVQRARQLRLGNQPAQLIMHWETAQALQHRGLFKWADEEYRQLIEANIPELAFDAQRRRAEMWHDQGENLDAAEALQQALKLIEQIGPANLTYADTTPEELRARMNYFRACHWQDQADPEKHAKYLKAALESDPTEIDVLIACWKLKDQTPEFHERVGELIDHAAAALRSKIGNPPEDASACNQFAWLVGNSTGDFDEALSYSLKALDLLPDSGAFYDTLAHVYFAKGDVENAVKNQARAAELEPHSGLIRRQLEVFRAALPSPKSPDASADKTAEAAHQ